MTRRLVSIGIAAGVAGPATIGALAMIGDVKTVWSFSALTVLIYYAVTTLAAF